MSDDAKFCEECGVPLAQGVPFCDQCGHSISAAGGPLPTLAYPVRLEIDSPEPLSRLLIFVKWLFSIPRLIVRYEYPDTSLQSTPHMPYLHRYVGTGADW